MNQLLLYSLAFNAIASVLMVYYIWRIWRMKVTPNYTWSLFLLAALISIEQLVWGVFYLRDVSEFIAQYPTTTLLISYGQGAIRTGLILVFVVRVYFCLKSKFPKV